MRLLQQMSGGEEIASIIEELSGEMNDGRPLHALTATPPRVAAVKCKFADEGEVTYPFDPVQAMNTLRFEIAELPAYQVRSEELVGKAPADHSGLIADRILLRRVQDSTVFPGAGPVAEIFHGKRGSRPHEVFESTGLLTPQLVRPLGTSSYLEWSHIEGGERAVLEAADGVTSALENITVLDPSPDDVRRRGLNENTPLLYPSGAGTLAVLAHLRAVAPESYEAVQKATQGGLASEKRFFSWASHARGPWARFLAIATALVTPAEYFATSGPSESQRRTSQLLIVIDEPFRDAPPHTRVGIQLLLRLCKQMPGKRVLLSTADPACLSAVQDVYGPDAIVDLDS